MLVDTESIETSPGWCTACSTRHTEGSDCPGELRPTGPDRHGWRSVFKTPHGGQTIGVLLTPAGSRWYARILTYPRVLWSVPGGSGAMKFVGDTADQAERQAVEFVLEHTLLRGHRRLEDLPAEVSVRAPAAGAMRATPRPATVAAPAPRRVRALPVLWGLKVPPSEPASTHDLSFSGMFVQTRVPAQPADTVHLRLDLGDCSMPLKGRVVWVRERPERPGRPAGMGIQLMRPPALYIDYVRHLE